MLNSGVDGTTVLVNLQEKKKAVWVRTPGSKHLAKFAERSIAITKANKVKQRPERWSRRLGIIHTEIKQRAMQTQNIIVALVS